MGTSRGKAQKIPRMKEGKHLTLAIGVTSLQHDHALLDQVDANRLCVLVKQILAPFQSNHMANLFEPLSMLILKASAEKSGCGSASGAFGA